MAFSIPEEEVGGITAIQKLSAVPMKRLLGALVSAPPTSNPRKMAEQIIEEVPGVTIEQLSKMLDTLYTLYHIRELSGVPYSQFLDDLIEALEEDRSIRFTAAQVKRFSVQLAKLMDIENLKIIAKAARLQRDGERLYCRSKVLSDIRPVFGNDPTARPLGSVLTHTLKLSYHEGSDHKEFHVILDSSDLEALAEVVQRARDKDNSIRDLLDSSYLPSLDN